MLWEPDDPDVATLDEVLAFLDSCSDPSSSGDQNSNNDDTGSDATTAAGDSDTQRSAKDDDAEQQDQKTCNCRKRRKTKEDGEKLKRPPRQRTNRKRLRPEILQLRQLIVDLEARLTCLQRVRERGGVQPVSVSTMMRNEALGQPDATANAYENAVEEYRQLRRAQQQNLDLRQALVEQATAHEELQRLFAQNLTPEDLHFLCGIQSEDGVQAGMLGGERVYMYLEIHLLASKVILLLFWAISKAAATGGTSSVWRSITKQRGSQSPACGSALGRGEYVESSLCESDSFDSDKLLPVCVF
ncbi:hypothetical protein FI667_g11700, partial [Globisporangium splendens]